MQIQLSPSQQQVVDHRGTDLQVIACAGSGKTESISQRVAALINEGAEPASIVSFTFTERAAEELKERMVRRVEDVKGAEFLDRLGPMFVGTIHSYCFRLLQDYVPKYGNYDVLDEHRHAGLLSREYRRLGLSRLGPKHWQPIRDFLRTADVIANELIDPATLDGTPLGDCYTAYREMLERYHFLTFGMIISSAVEALHDPAIFDRVHGPLRHLVVDEYQDINPAQERLIALLAQPPVELCVVGDDDQSIYQWRGSEVRNILEFTKRRQESKTVGLETNRRSRPHILEVANEFAQSIPERLDKAMKPARKGAPAEVVAWTSETEADEAEAIAETILQLHDRGFRFADIAVLFRSVRTSAPPLLDALEERSIPFSCGGRTGLFLNREIGLFGEVFAWFVDGDWRDGRWGENRKVHLEGIVEGLERCFGAVPDLKPYLEHWRAFRLRRSRPVNLVGDFYRLLYKLGASTIDVDTAQGSARFGAFGRFSQVLADFESVNRRGRFVESGDAREYRSGRDRGKPYFFALYNYLLHYARDAYEDFEGEQTLDIDAVDILTIHQAKGLEWPVVFLPALVDGRFPSRLSGRPQSWLLPKEVFPAEKRQRYEGSEAEERRLFYVSLTRARDAVYLSRFERRARRFRPSPFLTEVAGDRLPSVGNTGRPTLPLPPPPGSEGRSTPPTLTCSFSDIAQHRECGYRYRLSQVFGYQQELAVELGYGRAIHHVLRRLAETSRDADGRFEPPDGLTLEGLVNDELYLPFADAAAFQRMRNAAGRLVRRYVAEHASDLKRVWAVERPFELHVQDGTVSGRADVILDSEGGQIGKLAIVDYKVAEDTGRDERYRQQLAVYASAGRGEGLDVEAAYLHELRDSTRHSVDIQQPATLAATQAMSEALGAIRRGDFTPRPETARCSHCDFLRICRHRETGTLH